MPTSMQPGCQHAVLLHRGKSLTLASTSEPSSQYESLTEDPVRQKLFRLPGREPQLGSTGNDSPYPKRKVLLVKRTTALRLLRIESQQLMHKRQSPDTHPRGPQPAGFLGPQLQVERAEHETRQDDQEHMDAGSRGDVHRVHIHLGVVDDVLVAVCCVEVEGPGEGGD